MMLKQIAFQEELYEVKTPCFGPWYATGNFNLIYNSKDKSNKNINKAMMGYALDILSLKWIS